MHVRVVTLKYDNGLAGFPEAALKEAMAGGALIELREHFFEGQGRDKGQTPRDAGPSSMRSILLCYLR